MKIEDSELENEQNITKEERISIAQEMEEILAARQKVSAPDKLTISSNTRLFSFPIYVNIVIFTLLILSVSGVYIYFTTQDKRFLNIQENTSFSENVLARLLIDEAQKAIEEQENKIKSINDQLVEEGKKKSLLEKRFDEQVQEFIEEEEKKFNAEIEKYRKKLEIENISSEEIKRRVQAYERELRITQEQTLARYKQEQNEKRQRDLAQFDAKVILLKQQVEDRKLQLQSLEQNINSEKEILEKELQQQREESKQEIVKVQNQITSLKKRNEKRALALESFAVTYRVALNSFNTGKYGDAQNVIQNFNSAVEQSEYKNDKELLRMKNSLFSISRALEAINILEKQVSQQSQVLEDPSYMQNSEEIQAMLTSGKEKIESLEQELANLNEDSQSERAANEKKLKTLIDRYDSLENKYKAIQTNGNKNMQVIINYLMLKKQNADTTSIASLKAFVDDLVVQDKYYGVLGVLLAQALDPSGELQF